MQTMVKNHASIENLPRVWLTLIESTSFMFKIRRAHIMPINEDV